ncbi:MAG: glucoamylase family protein [Hydrogenophaga sp.]|nr:glucoamylase family protein [Hydrogenophaga sp.]MDO8906759.1 glucoamylase family protein [Hydrogenophaga sp.]
MRVGEGPLLAPIRSEIFGLTRFEEHGRGLGASHRAERAAFGQTTFYPRLHNNIGCLRQAYRDIAAQAHEGHDISPSAEWLFDNFHLIEDQLREIREGLPGRYYRSLPVLLDAPLSGLPRVYGLAWAFVAHTDSAFDASMLVAFLNAYQDSRELSQGELWALPTTLRVVLIENLRRLSDRIAGHRAARELASQCGSRLDTLSLGEVEILRAQAAQRGLDGVFLFHLAQQIAGHRPSSQSKALPLLRQWMALTLPDLAALQAQHHADQAADQISMGNAVTALRLIGGADWSGIVAQTSRVMRVMLSSPVFQAEDSASRTITLHGIERLSARSGRSEAAVALALLSAMSSGKGDTALARHWLQGAGQPALAQALGMNRSLFQGAPRALRSARLPLYFGALLCGTLALVGLLVWPPAWQTEDGMAMSTVWWALAALLAVLPASEAVVALVNRLISESIQPVQLPRYLLAGGIPASARVMVVVPALLSHADVIAPLVHRLLLHHLANPEPMAQFALLTDWADADEPEQADDTALLTMATQQVALLNLRYPAAPGAAPRFLLLHRARSHCATQGQWIGWERKRGKLEQLVAALATDTPGPFLPLGELSRIEPGTRYLLTLDSDTHLPPGRLRALVGVAEHPENTPVLDASGQRVSRGYGILQPQVVPPLSERETVTPYEWLHHGQRGLDPYSAMSSDVYQDLFGEGSFTGKGLLHVATVHAVLGGRLPAGQVLSHDLIEGSLARCAVVTDITVLEADPTHADVVATRLHRWTRGDWQLLPFLLQPRRWPMEAINRWKLFDNLRRSLVAPASLALIGLSMLGHGVSLPVALLLGIAAQAAAPLMGALAGAVPQRIGLVGLRFGRAVLVDVLRAVGGGLWHLATLLQQTLLLVDALVRTLHRLLVSQRRLLEWTTAEAVTASQHRGMQGAVRRHGGSSAVALLMLAFLWWWVPQPQALAVAVLVLWALGPLVSWVANQPWRLPVRESLRPADRAWLDGVARDTWRLFERCVDAQNHFLPPDNLQTQPFDAVAHRTSPTNIGLYLLSTACARQMGWIGTQDLLARLEATLDTLHAMERHRGHFLNWYDTLTLAPLLPRYVSTVDSGNLCAHLLATAQACRDFAFHPHQGVSSVQAIERSFARIQPHLPALQKVARRPWRDTALGQLLQAAPVGTLNIEALATQHLMLYDATREFQALWPEPPGDHLASDELRWLLADHLATWRGAEQDAVAAMEGRGERDSTRLKSLACAFEQMAWSAEFGFLYHPQRELLHIGYRLDEQQLDGSFYDLLASESRTTSLLAIAKGDVPVRHWAALGRPFFASGVHAVLRSWSGSMFEYLMPSLVLAEPRGSVLFDAAAAAVREQIAFGHHLHLPWGVSESAYAGRDHTLAYQYSPQGVPRLALRRTPLNERVVAPYATALATQVDATAACRNLRRLESLSARGPYGFMEALDYTPGRPAQVGGVALVSTYMAHHQGMTIVALCNVLQGNVARRWGMAHPRIEAMLSLLHERTPRVVPPPAPLLAQRLPLQALQPRAPDLIHTVRPGEQALEPTHMLANGRYGVTLRSNGAGWSRWAGIGITRWRDDALRDASGHFIYLRLGSKGPPVSVTRHPAPDPSARYQSTFHADRMEFEALWPELRITTTVWVSPEDDIELRKVVLVNLSDQPMDVELISALDVTLATPAADEAHPAFSNLFVKARWLAEHQALQLERTPRLATERTVQAAHFVAAVEGQMLGLNCQTDRHQWLGRNHTPSQPLARLRRAPEASQALDTGLDPVAVLGVRLRLPPGRTSSVTFGTAASDDAATLLAVIDKYRQPVYAERASVMSATLAGIQSVSHRPRPEYLPALQAITTALVMTLPWIDPDTTDSGRTGAWVCDRRLLWPLGISGDRPLLLVSAGTVQGMGLLRILAQALREWSRCGVTCDVVVISNEAHSYHMPLQSELAHLQEQQTAHHRSEPSPATAELHLLRAEVLSEEQLHTLEHLARLHLHADGRAWLHQVRDWRARFEALRPDAAAAASDPVPTREAVLPALGSRGEFSPDGSVFSFEVGSALRPARPWVNVLANPGFGAMLSESGGGNTWALNSRLNQLTAWANDPVGDPPGEWFLLQDRRTREVWSVSPSAWGEDRLNYRVEHGQGLTTISHRRGPLEVSVNWCVDADTSVKQVRITLVNRGTAMAHLRLVGMVEWVMGEKRTDRATLETRACFEAGGTDVLTGLLCTQREAAAGFGGGTAFFCEADTGHVVHDSPAGLDWTCDRSAFFGEEGELVLPRQLGQRSGYGLDPCAALSRMVTLRPGATLEQVYLIGYAASAGSARSLMRQSRAQPALAREETNAARWDDLLGATEVHTPDPLFDAMVNRWLLYQTVSSRLWAKAGYYQAGGATGYRDQLQDTMALSWARPAWLREQIVLCASRQFEAGDVQHWWHSPGGAGVRTHFSDDLLWLPYACAHYLKTTQDRSVLDETVPFLQAEPIPEGAEDAYTTPAVGTDCASVFEHAARTIDRSLKVGEHGLPLMGGGDWNDGMNRVGHEGRGESVWLGWFLCTIVREWIPLAIERGETARADRWTQALHGWLGALHGPAWDGRWYRRAFFDDGSALGSAFMSEGRIDLIAQAWSVLSGETPLSRQRMAMEAVETHLVNREAGLIQLLAPPLVSAEPSAGYIQAYPPGVRENGGQYAHAGVWALMAAAALAAREPPGSPHADTAYRYFTFLSPAHRAQHKQWGLVYGTEPYAVAADVYSQPPYEGRGGWSWYTGAAGWLHRAAVGSLLGLQVEGDEVFFTPCLPSHWPGAEITLRRDQRQLRVLLVRAGQDGGSAIALPVPEGAQALAVGERLHWPSLAPESCLVVTLPEI